MAMTLVALGVTNLSMAPAAIGPVKAALLKTDLCVLRQQLIEALDNHVPEGHLRPLVQTYADSIDVIA